MILKHYYKLEKCPDDQSKQRMDCPSSTGDYPQFEQKRRGKPLYFYIGPDTYNNPLSVAIALKCKSDHISRIEVPDTNKPFWIGDVKGTSDTLLISVKAFERIDGRIMPGSVLEVFIAPGKSSEKVAIFNIACNGDLAEEMEALRKKSQ